MLAEVVQVRLYKRDESYFRKHVMIAECHLWNGPHRLNSNGRSIPIARLTKDIYIDAALIGYAIHRRCDIPDGQNYKFTCAGDNLCVNGAHVFLYYPNRSGRKAVPFEHRGGYELQFNGLKPIIEEYPNSPAKLVLAKFRASGGHIKGEAFSRIYHEVREVLGLPFDSIGRGRKKVTF